MAQGKTGARTRASTRSGEQRPKADDLNTGTRDSSSKERSQTAAQQDKDTRAFFQRVASDKDASLAFLKAAGIVDARGDLRKPYRG